MKELRLEAEESVTLIPIEMAEHRSRIECLVAGAAHHSNIVVSSDLKHEVLVWDSTTGSLLNELDYPIKGRRELRQRMPRPISIAAYDNCIVFKALKIL